MGFLRKKKGLIVNVTQKFLNKVVRCPMSRRNNVLSFSRGMFDNIHRRYQNQNQKLRPLLDLVPR